VENTIIKPPSNMNDFSAVLPGGRMPTIRGFRITRDPMPDPLPIQGFRAIGINGSANVEYCIIENQVNMPEGSIGTGGAIANCNGTIQNNIIRNNRAHYGAAAYGCGGVIRNNVLYGNGWTNGTLSACSAKIINNTLFHGGSLLSCQGEIVNNIIWSTSTSDAPTRISQSSSPQYCLIKFYTGPGVGNIDTDPKFVDPDNFDLRLQADSPAIDAGKASTEIKADFKGVQRGLKGVPPLRGDGSAIDIGAFEYIPKPVGVWLPDGGPDDIRTGDAIDVAWQMEVETAGTTVGLRLFRDGVPLTDFGRFSSGTSTGLTQVVLTDAALTSDRYYILGASALNPFLSSRTAQFAVTAPNAIRSHYWRLYD
jgi:hypothetical protein